jgi:hypothetical protein
MDLAQYFVTRHGQIHAAGEALLDSRTDEQIRSRPEGDQGSVAWRLWHAARVEDADFARLVKSEQLIAEQAWLERLNVTEDDAGKGLKETEAADLSSRIDLGGLRAYWEAVGKRTLDIVPELSPDDLDQQTGGRYAYLERTEDGLRTRVGMWVSQYRSGQEDPPGERRPRSLRAHLTLGHLNRHLRTSPQL